jgi:hypothetical protein
MVFWTNEIGCLPIQLYANCSAGQPDTQSTAGGLSPDHSRWTHPKHHFFLPVRVLSRVFAASSSPGSSAFSAKRKLRFHGNLRHLSEAKLFHRFLRQLFRQNWVVYAKPPFGGPEYVHQYLARYTHRVAISNHRLISLADGQVGLNVRLRLSHAHRRTSDKI